jgi:hypothetical protein
LPVLQDAEPLTTNTAPLYIAPTAPLLASTAPPATDEVRAYLLNRFSAQFEDLEVWRSRDYGTAYMRCLIERQVLRICQMLGIGLMGRVHTPAVIGNMSIRLEDVVSAAGINSNTFSTFRTEFRQINQAHVALRQRERSNTVPQDFVSLLRFLDVMLAERILDTACTPSADQTEASELEATVVRMQITTLMGQVRTVLQMFDLL